MDELERKLRSEFEARAQTIPAGPDRREPTVRRARTRRGLKAIGVSVISVALIAGAVPVAGSLASRGDEDRRIDAAAPEDEGFTWREGPAPAIATGRFGDIDWKLEVVQNDHPYQESEDEHVGSPRDWLDLSVYPDNYGGAQMPDRMYGDGVLVYSNWELEGSYGSYAFGLVASEVQAITIEMEDGSVIDAPILDGPGDTDRDLRYFVVFFPSAPASIVARDQSGSELQRETLEPLIWQPPSECVDHNQEGPPQEDLDEDADFTVTGTDGEPPIIATGTFHGRTWTMETVTNTHPWDEGEDDGVEREWIHFGFDDSNQDWEVPAHAYAGPLDSYLWGVEDDYWEWEFAFGLVDDAAQSISLELKNGRVIEGAVFDGSNDSVAAQNYYLVIVPPGTHGKDYTLIARDSAGAEVARSEPIDKTPVHSTEMLTCSSFVDQGSREVGKFVIDD